MSDKVESNLKDNEERPVTSITHFLLALVDVAGPAIDPSKMIHTPPAPLETVSEVSMQDFSIIMCVGSGPFGKVFKVKHQQTGKICALKVISRQSSNEPIAEQIEKEVTTKIDHPFIIKLNDSFKTPNKVYLVMDFLSYGDILSLTSKRGILREEEAKFYIIEIILALEHLHKMNIIHKNLKPDNILISKEGHVVVTDYGLQTVSHSTNDGEFMNTVNEYMAPEYLMGVEYNNSIDYWSLGVLLYRLLVGRTPFVCKEKLKLPNIILTRRVEFPPMLSPDCISLLKGLLHRNTTQRLGSEDLEDGVAELKANIFLATTNWDDYLSKKVKPPCQPLFINTNVGRNNNNNNSTNGNSLPSCPYISPINKSNLLGVIPEEGLFTPPPLQPVSAPGSTLNANNSSGRMRAQSMMPGTKQRRGSLITEERTVSKSAGQFRTRGMTFSTSDMKDLTYKPLSKDELQQMVMLYKNINKKSMAPEVPKVSSRAWARRLSVDEVDIGFEALSDLGMSGSKKSQVLLPPRKSQK